MAISGFTARTAMVVAVVVSAWLPWANTEGVARQEPVGATVVTTWPQGRSGAVSVTYDDASINQFRVAAPLMTERVLPGTFFVLTGHVSGSRYAARFVGRDAADVVRESATAPTTAANFRERLSAAPFLGLAGLIGLRTSAAPATPDTFTRVDDAYRRVRAGELEPLAADAAIYMDNDGLVVQAPPRADVERPTWDDVRRLVAAGHEVGSHTITHPRLDALDDANILYELERSRQEIREQVGERQTFSVEAPFGIEDERVMTQVHRIYPAARNRMPHPWLDELNRSSRRDPTTSDRQYVQWQRGIVANTTDEDARAWLETTARDGRIWLVIVVHGVEGVGWEAVSRETLAGFFDDLASRRGRVWVATFQNVTKYMRERMAATIGTSVAGDAITVTLTHPLDPAVYDQPLTLETRVPIECTRVRVEQGRAARDVRVTRDVAGSRVQYDASPNAGPIVITRR